jgi:hypothetical protein
MIFLPPKFLLSPQGQAKSAPPQNEALIMRGGGAGWKIPFDLVKEFRGFSG